MKKIKKNIVRLTVSKLERECEIVFEFRSASPGSAPECHINPQGKTPFRQYFYGKEIICITESIGRSFLCTVVWQIALRPGRSVTRGEREREKGELLVDHFASCAVPIALIYLSKSFSNISKDFLVFDDVVDVSVFAIGTKLI